MAAKTTAENLAAESGLAAPGAMAGAVALRSLTLRNVLSFGAEAKVELGPLNVLIGPNGCGKSNLMDVVALLKAAATTDLSDEFRGGGADWPWKGETEQLPKMLVKSEWRGVKTGHDYRHQMEVQVRESGAYSIVSEMAGLPERGVVAVRGKTDARVSILRPGVPIATECVDDPAATSEENFRFVENDRMALSFAMGDVGLYRSRYVGRVGRLNPLRLPSHADMPDGRLTETLDNFAVALRRVYADPARKSAVDEKIREFHEDARGLRFINVAKDAADTNAVAVALREAGDRVILAPRMSDGMLNWLFLLTILLDPKPPALVCIDEPEAGLHMDALPALAELLRDASARTQIIIATHSDMLVDHFTCEPEAVVVCDKVDGVTQMKRLRAEDFQDWKEEGLGMAWISGAVGGKRW